MKGSSIDCLDSGVNFAVVVYDIRMTQTVSLMGLIRRAFLLVETTFWARTADVAGRACSEVLFRVSLHHTYLFFKIIRYVSYFYSLYEINHFFVHSDAMVNS